MKKMKSLFPVLLLVFSSVLSDSLFAQQCTWVQGMFCPYGILPIDVVTNASGSVYMLMYSECDSLYFGTSLTIGGSFSGLCLAKYDAAGNALWAKPVAGLAGLFARAGRKSMAIDVSGNIYLTGSAASSTTYNTFLLKLDSAGGLIWTRSELGPANYADMVTTDISGNVFITGPYSETITFGSTTFIDTVTYLSAPVNNIFLVKYDSSGNVIWAKSSEGADGGPDGIASDSSGNVYLSGEYSVSSISFDGFTLEDAGSYYNHYSFLVKYNSSGSVAWAKNIPGIALTGSATDASGNSYLAGILSYEDIFLAKYNNLGNLIWTSNVPSLYSDDAYDIVVDSAGNAYMCGFYDSITTFGTTTFTGHGMFVAKFNSSGYPVWAQNAITPNRNPVNTNYIPQAVAIDGSANLYFMGGIYAPSAVFNTITLPCPYWPFDSAYNPASFLAKYDVAKASVPTIVQQSSLSLFPNPTTGEVYVSASVANIKVYNVIGQLIKEEHNTSNITIAEFPSGMYFIKIFDNQGQVIKQDKIVKL